MHQSFFDLLPREEEEKVRHALSCSVLTESQSMVETRFRKEPNRPVTWQVECIGIGAGIDSPDRFLLKEIPDHPACQEHSTKVAEAVVEAREQERTRIGLELHDNVNQILFTCKLYLDLIKPALPKEIELKEKTLEFLMLAIEEVRLLSKDLVIVSLMDNGLLPRITQLLEELRATNLFKINFTFGNEDLVESMDDKLKVTLFRIVQEQLKNIIKYSRAQQIDLQLSAIGKEIHLSIEDDGVGFDALCVKKGIGLSSICERTKMYRGLVAIKTRPGHGCRISVAIPIV